MIILMIKDKNNSFERIVLMKKYRDYVYIIFALLLVASLSGCGGSGTASGGVNLKGKKIGYVPPS